MRESMTDTARHSKTKTLQRGFTLTELSIVLGIIGLILGAIWVAASAVYSNLHLATANTQLLQVTQAVRAMYATSVLVDPGADMTTGTQAGGAAGAEAGRGHSAAVVN